MKAAMREGSSSSVRLSIQPGVVRGARDGDRGIQKIAVVPLREHQREQCLSGSPRTVLSIRLSRPQPVRGQRLRRLQGGIGRRLGQPRAGVHEERGDEAREDANIVQRQPNMVFTPSSLYAYTAEPAGDGLVQGIEAGAGARTTYCQ